MQQPTLPLQDTFAFSLASGIQLAVCACVHAKEGPGYEMGLDENANPIKRTCDGLSSLSAWLPLP